MRRHWRRILGWSLAVVAVVVLIIAAAGWWLLATESGARWAVSRAVSAAPGSLQIQEVNGRLWGPLALHGVVYEDSLLKISVGRSVLNWSPTEILAGRVAVAQLSIDDLGITLKPASKKAEPNSAKAKTSLPDLNLPFDLQISELRIQPLWLRLPESPESLVIDRIALDNISLKDSLEIQNLIIESALGDIVLHGAVLTRGEYPLDLELDWTLRPPGYPEVIGHGRFSGNLQELVIRQETSTPFTVELDARIFELTGARGIECRVNIVDFETSALDPSLPPVRVRGVVNAKGKIENLESDGRLNLASAQYGDWSTDFRVKRDGDLWRLLELEARMPGDSMLLHARGEVNPGGEPMSFRLDADWENLRWPLRGEAVAGSGWGKATVNGTLAAYDFDADARLSIPDAPASEWNLRGRGTADGIDIDPLYGEILDGWIHGTGSLDWRPVVRWEVVAVGDGIDPGAYLDGYPGNIGFEIRTLGEVNGEDIEGEMHLVSLDGELLERPLSGMGSVEFQGEKIMVSGLELGYAGASLAAAGDILGPWDLEWELEMPALGTLLPEYEGSFRGKGSLVGQDSLPRIQASIVGDSIAFGAGRIRSIVIESDINPAPEGNLDLDLSISGIQLIQGTGFDSILVRSRGTRERHTVEIDFHVEGDSVQIGFAGEISDSAWSGALERLHLRSVDAGVWDLDKPAPVRISPSRSELEDLCWRSGAAKFCLRGFWDAVAGWEFDSTLEDLNLAVFDRLFPTEASFDVRLDGHARAGGDPRGLAVADVKIESEPGEIHWISGGRDLSLDLDAGLFALEADSQMAEGTFRLGIDGGTIAADLRLPDLAAGRGEDGAPLDGELKLEFPDLSAIQGISAGLGSIRGSLLTELTFGGTTKEPEIGGQIRLENGSFEFPRLGLEVHDISIQARSERGRRWDVDGGMTSGPGRVTITAETKFLEGEEGSSHLKIKGERFEVVNALDSRVLVSPDLEIRFSGKRVDVEGEVVIPEANIVATQSELAMATPVSQDVVFTDTSRVKPPPPIDVHARVRIVLGKQVRFRGFGLRTRATGDIVAIDSPGTPTLADGELALMEGTYTGYGRELNIDRGRVIYHNSPIDNPELDIRTSRRADDGTIAGFEIKGRLIAPELTVFSEPERTQEDALSYVLYGRPLNDASNQEANLAQQTAALLTMQAGSQLTQGMASSVGLEEARIESEGSMKEASLMLGTHLSPKLYVAYGIGLFEAVNSFRVKYSLNNRWAIQAESGRQTSADIIFNIEK